MLVLAKTAGFCFGVKNAVNTVENLLKENKKVCSLGNVIHSPQVVQSFKSKGVRVLKSVEEVKSGEVLVLRSHGVGPKVYDVIEKRGIIYKDAICPFVKRIHKRVFEESIVGRTVLFAGDVAHPEVRGTLGYCTRDAYVFSNLYELKKLFSEKEYLRQKKIFLIAQTTFNVKVWEDCVLFIKQCCKDLKIFCSICSATIKRQKEAILLSKNSDVVVVIGGKNSSNTKKLYDLCKDSCKAFLVEGICDFEMLDFDFRGKNVGVTAGASTPDYIIKEVFERLQNILK